VEGMKFNENNADIKTIPNITDSLIYFLINGNEVVYVGQTHHGLRRPFSHSDKDFTEIKILICPPHELDYWEDCYIQKYNPLYNRQSNYKMHWGLYRVRQQIRKSLFPKYTLWNLREVLKELQIVPERDTYNSKETISFDEYKQIMQYLNAQNKEAENVSKR
jgi:hypothetical protein